MRKKLKYSKYEGLKIICTKCRREIHVTNTPYKGCKHPIENQRYKAGFKIPDGGGKRRTRVFSTTDYNEAVKQLIDFKNEIKQESIFGKKIEKVKPSLFIDTVEMYYDYLNNVNVPFHLQKQRTKPYVDTTIGEIKYFLRFLKSKGVVVSSIKIDDVNDNLVGDYCKYLESLNLSNYTYNAKVKALRRHTNHLIDIEKYDLTNVWKSVKSKPEKATNASISKEDFNDVLKQISPNNSIKIIGKGKRNMYKNWLVNFVKLKCFTGGRNDEIVYMKWNWVHFEDGTPVYVKMPNTKINLQKGITKEADYEYVYIPIVNELNDFFNELDVKSKEGSNDYIIAPAIKLRSAMSKDASRGFSFFAEKLKRPYEIELNYLRKTYITRLQINSIKSSPVRFHSNNDITNKHYIDAEIIAIELTKSKIQLFN